MAGPIPLWSQCAVNSTTCFASVGSLPVSFATTFSDLTRRTALTMSTAAWSPVATGRKSRRAAARVRESRFQPVRASVPCTAAAVDRKSTRLNSSHDQISYAVFCLKKKKKKINRKDDDTVQNE